jgi:hypothetical protein
LDRDKHFPRLEGTNYCTYFSLWRGQDFGEDCEAANGGPLLRGPPLENWSR